MNIDDHLTIDESPVEPASVTPETTPASRDFGPYRPWPGGLTLAG